MFLYLQGAIIKASVLQVILDGKVQHKNTFSLFFVTGCWKNILHWKFLFCVENGIPVNTDSDSLYVSMCFQLL